MSDKPILQKIAEMLTGRKYVEPANQTPLEALEYRVRAILPEQYQDYESVEPVSMGTAPLKYGADGKVAWDEIWGSFCDLAMAGGPPHKGSLLEPGSPEQIEREHVAYRQVVDEICRGIKLATGLDVHGSPGPGWVAVECEGAEMAGWLARAIAMENVSVRLEGNYVYLPAGPAYRLPKEIKNVVTVIAKTAHYWEGHMWLSQQRTVGSLFELLAAECPLVQPVFGEHYLDDLGYQNTCARLAESIQASTGLKRSGHRYAGWLGLECGDVKQAIWLMRALVASNVLARREGTVLFVPVNPESDPDGRIVGRQVAVVFGLAAERGVVTGDVNPRIE